jgi:hypothetical protein
VKLAYLLRYYPTRSETFVYDEARALMEAGHVLRCFPIGAREDGDELPGWPVQRPPRWARLRPLPSEAEPMLAWQPRKRLAEAAWVADQLEPDEHLHVHFAGEAAEWALLAHRLRGLRFGVTVHAVDLFKPRPSLPEVLAAADPLITISEHNQRLLRERYGVEAHLVRSGVELGEGAPERGVEVLAVARRVPKKGLDLLEAACAQLDLPLRVLSEASRQEVREALSRAAVFCLPCRVAPDGDRDGLPVSFLEAMAHGLPVVSTTLPGFDELLDEEVGWQVPPEDLPALSAALASAMASPEERARRGRAARQRVVAGWTRAHQTAAFLAAWGVTDS